MRIDGTVALVTGAGRGIGREFVRELLARGAAKVYAAGRGRGTLDELARADPAVVPVVLDVTDAPAVAAAARRCADVELLVNNAGVNLLQGVISAPDLGAAELEMRTNCFGPPVASRAFATVLAANGGGADVYPGEMAAELARGLAADPKAVERELARILPA